MWNRNKEVVANLIKLKLERITKWLAKSGLKVNESKAEMCLFYKQDTTPINIVLSGETIASKQRLLLK